MNPAEQQASPQVEEEQASQQYDEYLDQQQKRMVVDYVLPYGKKTKPRFEDPSMFELMQWNEAENAPEFKSSKDALRDMDDFRRYKALLDRANDGHTSEAKDNYRKFVYRRIDDPNPHIPFESSIRPSHDKSLHQSEHAGHQGQGYQQRLKDGKLSEYEDEISRKEGTENYRKMMKTLLANENERNRSRSHDVTARAKSSENYKRSELLDWPDEDEMREIREQERIEREQAELEHQEMLQRLKEEEEAELVVERPDYSKVQNRLLSYKVEKRRALDPVKDKDRIKRREDRIQKFKEQTRWLPNSAFQTYYGKPAFESYGMGNTNPTWGGLGYGSYMISHNVNPHRYPNKPSIKQVTSSSELSKSKYDHIKEKYQRRDEFVPRKTKDEYVLSENQVKDAKESLSLAAVKRLDPKKDSEGIEVRPFYKPDLKTVHVFASRDNSPAESERSSNRKKK